MAQNDIRTVLSQHPTIPVVTFHHTDEVAPKMEALIARGIFCIEITLRTPAAFDCIALAKKHYGDRCAIGMGTVVKVEQIEKAIELGIDFMVSPGLNASLAPHFENSKIAFIPGVATPSEIIEGIQFGWDTFKFFPANLFGGLGALKAYGQVFPNIKFCPTGGITEESYPDYLALSNIISVGGSWM
jgi:2-dehydro-3-deoxyphosphogluconate aldolase/(4S)-4-hydroxy-2-oxoglutarate aldolase